MTLTRREFDGVNSIKADCGDIYGAPDPRKYFQVLGNLDYDIPQIAQPVFTQIVDRLIAVKGRAEGTLHAELFMSRPPESAELLELTDLITVTCGYRGSARSPLSQAQISVAAA
jgi:hypothetical protein